MNIKTFISQSDHLSYYTIVANLLDGKPIAESQENELYHQLAAEKKALDRHFSLYKAKMEELHKLIGEYYEIQKQMRKSIRSIQLQKAGKKKPATGIKKANKAVLQ